MLYRLPGMLVACVIAAGSAFGATFPAIAMRVSDEAGNPIEGAVVLLRGEAAGGGFYLHGNGSQTTNLFLVETQTGSDGKFHFDKQMFWPHPFLLKTHDRRTHITVFKEGFQIYSISTGFDVQGLDGVTSWRWNDGLIKLLRATSDTERYDAADRANDIAWLSITNAESKGCGFVRIRNFMGAAHMAARRAQGARRLQSAYERLLQRSAEGVTSCDIRQTEAR
ncbi:carboxypeptidase-like regulatory domain-containing protein [Rhizobacter sp. Root404]|uniref:carboxypeptidase-like regulatory domain-containing protein n=1 Tax=Rhizobacter sp. Root404 TaxID=1736528 RepID=UPI0012F70F11|nr:carboxypeptidase-like regulatory domain-containing protein [Rhizobacter sp. Root404]